MAKFKERAHELEEEARKRPSTFFKSQSTLRQLVNMEFQWLLMYNFFDPEATIIFKRDWHLGHTPFRTTWTAGWYLSLIYGDPDSGGLGVRSGGMWDPDQDRVMIAYEKRKHAAEVTMRRESFRQRLPSMIGDRTNTAMILVDLEATCNWLQEKAKKIGDCVDRVVCSLAKKYGGTMKGYPEHRVKGTASLRRKLIAEVAELLQLHRDDVTFTPDMNDCVTAIHDVLRYTICFPPETYTKCVKAVEKELFMSGIARRIKFKNFWQEEDLMSTYV